MWKCLKCNTENEDKFLGCWKCGYTREGDHPRYLSGHYDWDEDTDSGLPDKGAGKFAKFQTIGFVLLIVLGVAIHLWSFTARIQEGRPEGEAADITDPKKLYSEKYELEYPSNWHIDYMRQRENPDNFFLIESPAGSEVMFSFHTPEIASMTFGENGATLEEFWVETYKKRVHNHKITHFTRLGKYEGSGTMLRGIYLYAPSTVKIFSATHGDTAAIIIEIYNDKNLEFDGPGYELIERTLTLYSRIPAQKR